MERIVTNETSSTSTNNPMLSAEALEASTTAAPTEAPQTSVVSRVSSFVKSRGRALTNGGASNNNGSSDVNTHKANMAKPRAGSLFKRNNSSNTTTRRLSGSKVVKASSSAASAVAEPVPEAAPVAEVKPPMSWTEMVNNIAPAIVSLSVNRARHFEESAGAISGTGFVVDKTRGFILTNRHVVTLGPVVAEASLHNLEELQLKPVYRDPVHDFGFFQFDPSEVKFSELVELPLCPQQATVGTEVRVVGNDNGEQMTILSGTVSRVDREAPGYDFNTYYITAASSTSGGSSGSPVLNQKGEAIALNSGGLSSGGATSFFFPLDRALRALKLLQNTPPGQAPVIPRGTLQCVFRPLPFEEVRRLGVPTEEEGAVRKFDPKTKGMLVVSDVVPEGPAHRAGLQGGDVLLKAEGKRITAFIPLEELLDAKAETMVGKPGAKATVSIEIWRGQSAVTMKVEVDDLHRIIPNEFMEVSQAIVHPMSYQFALACFLPLPQLLVTFPGYMFKRGGIAPHSVIVSVNDVKTPDLDSFEKVMASLPDGSKALVRHFHVSDTHRVRTKYITIDRRWYAMRRGKRNLLHGRFDMTDSPTAPDTKPILAKQASFNANAPLGDDEVQDSSEDAEAQATRTMMLGVARALVEVEFNAPYMLDGRNSSKYIGTGVIVDKEKGLVLVDCQTVVSTLGDVQITVGLSVVVTGTPIFVHPIYNYAFVKFDPADLGSGGSDNLVDVQLSSEKLKLHDKVRYVGLSGTRQITTRQTKVTAIDRLYLGESSSAPSFTAKNQEVYTFDKDIDQSIGGIVVDAKGKIQAMYSSFARGDRSEYTGCSMPLGINMVLKELRKDNARPLVPSLGVGYTSMMMSEASVMGLSKEWFQKLDHSEDNRRERKCLMVRDLVANSSASKVLQIGDLLLSVNDTPVVTPTGAEEIVLKAYQKTTKRSSKRSSTKRISQGPTVTMRVLRNQKEEEVVVEAQLLDGVGTSHLVEFAGLITQPNHLAVNWLGFVPEGVVDGGVYTSGGFFGSPAHKYGIPNGIWIKSVNSQPCKNLEEYKQLVSKIGDREDVRLETVSLLGKKDVQTLRTDLHYWRTSELVRDPKTCKWDRKQVGSDMNSTAVTKTRRKSGARKSKSGKQASMPQDL